MQIAPSPPLTRSDIVRVVLRVQLWVSVVQLGQSLLSAFTVMSQLSSGPSFTFNPYTLIYGPGLSVVPVFLLLLFPGLLAANALGNTEREPVASWEQVRPLIGRCVGLWLFVQSVGGLVLTIGSAVYDMATASGNSLFNFGTWVLTLSFAAQVLAFLLGFFLAFGPAIWDNFRSR